MKITATFEYSGHADYWGGNGRRWDRNAGCAFAFYGRDTTLRDIIDQWVQDTWTNDADLPDCISDDDIREAILNMLTDAGRNDYETGALYDGAQELIDYGDPLECKECGEQLGCDHSDDCEFSGSEVVEDDCDGLEESPIAVVLIEWEIDSGLF